MHGAKRTVTFVANHSPRILNAVIEYKIKKTQNGTPPNNWQSSVFLMLGSCLQTVMCFFMTNEKFLRRQQTVAASISK